MILLLLSQLFLSQGARWEHSFAADDDAPKFAFLGKFCFDAAWEKGVEVGSYTVDVTIPKADKEKREDLTVWLMSDEPSSWPAIYDKIKGDGITCAEAVKIAEKDAESKPAVTIGKELQTATCDGDTCTVTALRTVKENYVRWWFAIVTDCTDDLSGIDFAMHFNNTQRSSWNIENGYDITGLNTFFLVFFFAYFGFCCVHFYGVRQLSKKLEFVHPLVKLLAIVIIIEFLAVVFFMLHYGIYSSDGVGLNGLRQAAEVLDALSRVLFMLLLILVAKGWTVTGEELTGKFVIIGAIVGFLLIHSAILLWKFALEDPAAVKLETPLLVILYIETILWFGFAGYFTFAAVRSMKLEDNPVKKNLFFRLLLIFVPWFFLFPVIAFLNLTNAFGIIHEKVVLMTGFAINLLAILSLSFLTWPSRAEEYFNINKPDVTTSNIDTYEQL